MRVFHVLHVGHVEVLIASDCSVVVISSSFLDFVSVSTLITQGRWSISHS